MIFPWYSHDIPIYIYISVIIPINPYCCWLKHLKHPFYNDGQLATQQHAAQIPLQETIRHPDGEKPKRRLIWVGETGEHNDRQCYNEQMYWRSSPQTIIIKNHQQRTPQRHWRQCVISRQNFPWDLKPKLWFSDVGPRLIIDCAACQGINDSAMSHLAKVGQDCRDNGTTAEGFYFGFQIFGRRANHWQVHTNATIGVIIH